VRNCDRFYHFIIAVGTAKEAQSVAHENQCLDRSKFFRSARSTLASVKDAVPKERLVLHYFGSSTTQQ
jgi:hypothetical protein